MGNMDILIGHIKINPQAIGRVPGTNRYRVHVNNNEMSSVFFNMEKCSILHMHSRFMLTVEDINTSTTKTVLVMAVNSYKVSIDKKSLVELIFEYTVLDDVDGVYTIEPSPTNIVAYKTALAVKYACSFVGQFDFNDYFRSRFSEINHLGKLYHFGYCKVQSYAVVTNDEHGIPHRERIVDGVWVLYSLKKPVNQTDMLKLEQILKERLVLRILTMLRLYL